MVESWSDAARTINIFGLDSTRQKFSFEHTSNSDRSINETKHTIDEVEALDILSMTATPTAVPVLRGRFYVRISILWDDVAIKRLSAGYITDSKTMNYPPGIFEDFLSGKGYVTTVVGSDPAAAAEALETVGSNLVIKLLSMRINLVADANAANRRVGLRFDNGTNVFHQEKAGAVQTASTTVQYCSFLGSGKDGAQLNLTLAFPLPEDLLLYEGYRFYTATNNIQAGDNYGAPVYVRESWLVE